MSAPQAGDTYTYERTFTPEDVERFGEISGDQQSIHTDPDGNGRLVVQGLLTATIPTKIGADLEVLATEMGFEFHERVRTGERIACTVELDRVTERENHYNVAGTTTCENESEAVVLVGEFSGLIRK